MAWGYLLSFEITTRPRHAAKAASAAFAGRRKKIR